MTNAVNAIPDHVGTYSKSTTQSWFGSVRAEAALHVIRRTRHARVGSGSDDLLPAPDPAQPLLTHQPFDRAPGDHEALAAQEVPDLPEATDPAPELQTEEHPLDLGDQFRVTQRSGQGRPLLERVVAGRGDLHPVLGQHAADRLDPEPVTMIVNELNYHGKRGPSSRAKNEDAANKISFARFSSRTSASSALMR